MANNANYPSPPASKAAVTFSSPAAGHRQLDYRKSPMLMIASVVAVLNVIVMLVAFVTASWVVTYADLGAYGTKSQQVGLWQYCYKSSHRFSFRDARKQVSTDESVTPASVALAALLRREIPTPLVNCHWLWEFDFWYLKDYMQPRKFQLKFFFQQSLIISTKEYQNSLRLCSVFCCRSNFVHICVGVDTGHCLECCQTLAWSVRSSRTACGCVAERFQCRQWWVRRYSRILLAAILV